MHKFFNELSVSEVAIPAAQTGKFRTLDKIESGNRKPPHPSYSEVLKDTLSKRHFSLDIQRCMSQNAGTDDHIIKKLAVIDFQRQINRSPSNEYLQSLMRYYSSNKKNPGKSSKNEECKKKIEKTSEKTWEECPEPCQEKIIPKCEIIEDVVLPGCTDGCRKTPTKKKKCDGQGPKDGGFLCDKLNPNMVNMLKDVNVYRMGQSGMYRRIRPSSIPTWNPTRPASTTVERTSVKIQNQRPKTEGGIPKKKPQVFVSLVFFNSF